MGEVRRTGKYNKKGYFENRNIQKIHDQLLGLNRGSWSNPPSEIIMHKALEAQLKAQLKELKSDKPCGIKDPRTLLILNVWQELIGDSHQLIGTFRHPVAVAKSLEARSGMPIAQGLKLWVHYNQLLVDAHKKNPFPLIHFDLSDTKQYRANVIKIAKETGLKPNRWQLWRFISQKLENNQAKDLEVPANCAALYNYLLQFKVC